MARVVSWVRRFHRPAADGLPTLLVFPHAGAGASAYRDFAKALSAHFTVLVVQYPGRQDRAAEPACTSLAELAAGAFADFQTSEHNTGTPLVTFGHSMGGLVAFEFTRLADAAGLPVRGLTVSAAVAPSRVAAKPPHPTGDDEILAHLAGLEGTDSAVFANPDLMRLALPAIRADYAAFDAYSCADGVTVAAPIRVLGGDADPYVTLADLYGWNGHSPSVDITVFDGGHFFLRDHQSAVAELLMSCGQPA
ncbi:thioesterase [Mycobacterium sp. M1]|uniref:Thioesterase TesA n=1 Tax=Mycolicibacter acidiphilus TaxID=2835306 RepID=A0ABS5RJW2_9MYCO|nr:alpha/beta fold hydrolase [Mycolicibacter acidiphilus]MBS9534545.1 thioesterase [Mycolicibacter acidiphilus]